MICISRRRRRIVVAEVLSKSTPPKSTFPAEARIRLRTDLATVVLPQPLSPTKPNVLPGATSKLTPSTARTTARSLRQPRPRSENSTRRSRTASRTVEVSERSSAMTSGTGAYLGRYGIAGPQSASGVVEIYRARDERIHREFSRTSSILS